MHEAQFSASSTQKYPTLVILEEAVPQAAHEDIRLELLSPESPMPIDISSQPSAAGTTTYNPTSGSISEQLLGKVVERMYASDVQASDGSSTLYSFLSPSADRVFFAQWLNSGQKLDASIKYKLLWPEEKSVRVN